MSFDLILKILVTWVLGLIFVFGVWSWACKAVPPVLGLVSVLCGAFVVYVWVAL